MVLRRISEVMVTAAIEQVRRKDWVWSCKRCGVEQPWWVTADKYDYCIRCEQLLALPRDTQLWFDKWGRW
jgi:hypothetical protein